MGADSRHQLRVLHQHGRGLRLIRLYMDVVPNTPLKHYLALMPPAVDTESYA